MKVLAAILTVMVLAGSAMPATAQQSGFGLFFSDPRTDFIPPSIGLCKTDRQIRAAIVERGFTNVSLNAPNRRFVRVRATRDGWVYLLNYNFCTDRIEGAQQLRPAK